MQIERRVMSNSGEVLISAEDRANPERLIPDGCPPEFRAKIKLILIGRGELAAADFDQRSAEFRANAVERLRETAADL